MRYLLAVILLMLFSSVALGQPGPPTSSAPTPDPTIPTWVFQLCSAIASTVILALVAVVIAMWHRLGKKSALTEVQVGQLKDLHEWHDQRDADGVLKWMLPRTFLDLLNQVVTGQQALTDLVRRLVEQNDGITADLRQQLADRLSLHDKQQNKMLKVALRVQRAVEALAGLEAPEIEEDLGDEPEA
jgi:hypothetical protein